MKALLGSLLCLVLFASECFAISGGPPYPTGTNLAGVYAGVLLPAVGPDTTAKERTCVAGSLGIFTIGIPNSGASTGDFIIFIQGRVFGGSIQGVSDPTNAQLTTIVDATFTQMLTSLTVPPVMTTVTASVTGTLTAKISSPTNPLSPTSAFLNGEAALSVDNGKVDPNLNPIVLCPNLSFDVMGFRQSTVAPTGGTLTPPSA